MSRVIDIQSGEGHTKAMIGPVRYPSIYLFFFWLFFVTLSTWMAPENLKTKEYSEKVRYLGIYSDLIPIRVMSGALVSLFGRF